MWQVVRPRRRNHSVCAASFRRGSARRFACCVCGGAPSHDAPHRAAGLAAPGDVALAAVPGRQAALAAERIRSTAPRSERRRRRGFGRGDHRLDRVRLSASAVVRHLDGNLCSGRRCQAIDSGAGATLHDHVRSEADAHGKGAIVRRTTSRQQQAQQGCHTCHTVRRPRGLPPPQARCTLAHTHGSASVSATVYRVVVYSAAYRAARHAAFSIPLQDAMPGSHSTEEYT